MQELQNNSTLQGGKYRILSSLGQGGFGITYLAEQVMLGRKVAIKEFFMKDYCNRDEATSHVSIGSMGSQDMVAQYKEKFVKEARNIARLNHPNIVKIIDIFEDNDTVYYVMEYAECGSLSEKVKKSGSLSEPEAKRYILQIADAIGYIHERNMNHLDVKPANIMLNEKDETVLIDFGLSKQYDAKTGNQTSSTPVGISEGYAPMEQYKQGGVGEFSPETDIYALGATYFKLLTGVTPPSASDIYEDGVPVDELKSKGVGQVSIDVICKAMEGRKKDRMKTAGLFAQALQMDSDYVDVPEETHVVSEIFVEEVEEEPQVQYAQSQSQQPTKEEPIQKDQNRVEINGGDFNVYGVKFKMIKVIGGLISQSKTQSSGFLGLSNKEVVEHVNVPDFWIGETPVTQELWKAVMGNNPSTFFGQNLPVETVSWEDCQEFIMKLSTITGIQFRLPSETEWEFAARSGDVNDDNLYSGSDDIDDVAWYKENSEDSTHPVALKQPNKLGIYDMSGNVWEWCSDQYEKYNNNVIMKSLIGGSKNGVFYVNRGGSWCSSYSYCLLGHRDFECSDNKSKNLGLRLAISD